MSNADRDEKPERPAHAEDPQWVDPPWERPLDVPSLLMAIPEDATITGLFPAGVRDLARASNVRLERAQASYVAFKHYPLREHAELMVECAERVWPALPTRLALRKMGRGAAGVLLASQTGRAALSAVDGPVEVVQAMARAYGQHVRPGSVDVESDGDARLVVHMRDIHYFLDSHHVGVFEGVLRHAKVEGSVRLASRATSDADLLLTWR